MKAAIFAVSGLALILAGSDANAGRAAPTASDPILCKRAGSSLICTAFDKDGHWNVASYWGVHAISVKDVQLVLTPNGYNHTKAVLTFRSKPLAVSHAATVLRVNLYRAHVPIAEIDGDLAAADACSDFTDGTKVEQNLYANFFSLAGVPTEIVVSTARVAGANGTTC